MADADADTRALYREVLRMESCEVLEAGDGREALAKALVSPPSLIITELHLPIVNGFALCEILRRDRVTASVPIVVVTGEARDQELQHARRVGADDVLVKPAPTEVLVSTVRRLLSAQPGDDEQTVRAPHHPRRGTTTPPVSPPTLLCPVCDRPLVYLRSHVGGVGSRPEQWDDFSCPSCGEFEYRHRTRKLRRIQ